ncbi:hypothetical protein PR202_ga30429 [Eleusine coracana subsp. coracana]|uniref:Late embryogenesis abundant protein LEA-2 subgroup domain-containing protein n=1 Tax=Eleusine coracana subsp. coracana TaxID=191504 RepID=A0AAV5DND8_ELECO|nr:hypothetical protein PR202_ga30429 [Eleusine coracana subsp. coracana]
MIPAGRRSAAASLRTSREKIQCILITLFLAIVAIVATGIVLIIVIFGGPLRKIKITVDDASLTRFDLLTDPTTRLAYNLMLTMSVRNPNWAIGIKHDKPLEAAYSFDGQQFDRVQVVDKGEKQGPRKTVVYRLDTNSVGRGIALGNAGEAEFKKEKEEEGVFEVEVKLTGKFKYRLRYTKCEFEATCPVKMQLEEAPGAPAVVFQKVDCELTKSDDNNCKMVY